MANSKEKGDLTEARVLHELLSLGFSVSIPFGDNDPYDLLVDDGGELYRVQCKTAWTTRNGTMRFNTHSQTTRDGAYHERTYHGDIDGFIVRYPANERLYRVAIEDATRQKMELRFSGSIDHPSINWASDFEFDGELLRGAACSDASEGWARATRPRASRWQGICPRGSHERPSARNDSPAGLPGRRAARPRLGILKCLLPLSPVVSREPAVPPHAQPWLT